MATLFPVLLASTFVGVLQSKPCVEFYQIFSPTFNMVGTIFVYCFDFYICGCSTVKNLTHRILANLLLDSDSDLLTISQIPTWCFSNCICALGILPAEAPLQAPVFSVTSRFTICIF